ncbi:MAG: SDR family oxidoreductase [Planctomycetaceae bacterium]|jgi:thioester reductase-like protein|nr:SDR family oxidoreductase [Planctomycetaceae bacterium]
MQTLTHKHADDRFVVLTGATGLLGSYILHNLLKKGQKVAVIVRAGKKETAEHRIMKILDHWKKESGKAVPMPLVFSGDILDGTAFERISQQLKNRCRSVIHCAASLTFYGAFGGEPWLSNIEGTKRVLEFCREVNNREMHYVSTAYIAGYSRNFYEKDVDIGQKLRNDYEQSKLDAEKLVRGADFLTDLTVYRPSIVVGDSVTGYTPTFHGFYALLKLGHTVVSRMSIGSTSSKALLAAIGAKGTERKNFVPVDWVTDVFDHIYSRTELHGRTYHLTAPKPPLVSEFAETLQDAVETWSVLADKHDPNRADEKWFFLQFMEGMQTYRAYVQDDPQFDSSNTQLAAPHLPCPVMDRELMLFLARYAILSRFGKRKVNRAEMFPGKTDSAVILPNRSAVVAAAAETAG